MANRAGQEHLWWGMGSVLVWGGGVGLAGLQHHSDLSGWVSTSQDREYCVWSSASVPWPAPDLFIPPPLGAILAGMEATSGHVPWTVGHFPTTK